MSLPANIFDVICIALLAAIANRYRLLKNKRQARFRSNHPEVAIANRKQINAATKRWYASHREHCKSASLRRYYRNKPTINRQAAVRTALRMKSDPVFKLIRNFRGRLWKYVKKPIRRPMWELIGCSAIDLRKHIESLFAPKMSWENHGNGPGKWHIDHKRPISSFDMKDQDQQRTCWNFKNLQPLWSTDNLRKGASCAVF